MLQQAGDSVGRGGVNQRVTEFFVHDATSEARENAHMLIARSVFVQGSHKDELCFIIAPAHRRLQTRYADGGLLNVF